MRTSISVGKRAIGMTACAVDHACLVRSMYTCVHAYLHVYMLSDMSVDRKRGHLGSQGDRYAFTLVCLPHSPGVESNHPDDRFGFRRTLPTRFPNGHTSILDMAESGPLLRLPPTM